MNDIVKQSIEGRKNAIFNAYTITDQDIINKIEDLFKRINEFGDTFSDASEFESKFLESSLNKEYTDIFVEIAQGEAKANMPSAREVIADTVIDRVESEIRPSRAVMADKRDQMIRDIPVVGDVMNVKQHFDLFNKFRKKKKD